MRYHLDSVQNIRFKSTGHTIRLLIHIPNIIEILLGLVAMKLVVQNLFGMLLRLVRDIRVVQSAVPS